ncbi:MAG TPA: arylsulfatase [Tepidisphaeraceae bacterium]|jgi:arylsulfatase|nr:arylsulfatase [Tepidisphaeraceae bacterium]
MTLLKKHLPTLLPSSLPLSLLCNLCEAFSLLRVTSRLPFALFAIPLLLYSLPSHAAPPPNVILILIDDTGYGDLSCLGSPYVKTPNLDHLHDQSIRLTDFHVSPMCTPTRGQLMSGLDALANGAMNVSAGRSMLRLTLPTTLSGRAAGTPTPLPTLANLFQSAGYHTAIFGKWHLGDTFPYRPQDRGFQTALWFPSSHISSSPDHWNNDYFNPYLRQTDGTDKQFQGYCTDLFFDQAINWIKTLSTPNSRNATRYESSQNISTPFFLYLPLNAAHAPWYVPDHYRDPYRKLSPNLASFYGMIANIDENIAKLDTFLTQSHLADNTLLIYMTDNGGTVGVPTFNAGMQGAKISLFDGGHRVPCFLRLPTGTLGPPRDIPSLTEVQDILPTLSDLCNLNAPRRSAAAGSSALNPEPLNPLITGTSLLPLLTQNTPLPDRMLVVQFSRMTKTTPGKNDAAILWNHWRLLKGTDLYDISTDPHQDHNIASDHPDIVQKMLAHYDQWWSAISADVNHFSPIPVGDPAQPVTLLSTADWQNVTIDQQKEIRTGVRRNGPLSLLITRPGTYTFELRRFPREADTPIDSSLPSFKQVDGHLPAAKALPITHAKLRVGSSELSADVHPADKSITFSLPLPAGPTTAQSFFYDQSNTELCGAYYVYVERTKPN